MSRSLLHRRSGTTSVEVRYDCFDVVTIEPQGVRDALVNDGVVQILILVDDYVPFPRRRRDFSSQTVRDKSEPARFREGAIRILRGRTACLDE